MERLRLTRLAIAAASVCALAAAPGIAAAQGTATASMAVSVDITANCTVSAEPLAFGSVGAGEAPAAGATSSIEVACGGEVPFTVALDDGQNYADGTRRAIDPATGAYLAYEIYSDPARTQRWGASGAETVVDVTDADGTVRLTAYGAIAGDTQLAAGSYGDLVTVTTNF
jgi:spore coat protein U-like protein